MHTASSGFSLVELMVVIAIISILAITGIPSYRQYTQHARFSEVISATEPFKIAVAIALQSGTPAIELTNGSHGIPDEPKPTKNLASIKVTDGIIIATATELISSITYQLKPNKDGTAWTIGGTCAKEGLCNA